MKNKEIAEVILDIVDSEKRYIQTDNPQGDLLELRMQLREVAFALIQGKQIKAEDLH